MSAICSHQTSDCLLHFNMKSALFAIYRHHDHWLSDQCHCSGYSLKELKLVMKC